MRLLHEQMQIDAQNIAREYVPSHDIFNALVVFNGLPESNNIEPGQKTAINRALKKQYKKRYVGENTRWHNEYNAVSGAFMILAGGAFYEDILKVGAAAVAGAVIFQGTTLVDSYRKRRQANRTLNKL